MERLKEFRKKKSLSQVEMAELLGITLSMYQKVEAGRAGASASFMKRLKKVFSDINIDFIFFDDNSNVVADLQSKICYNGEKENGK